MRVELARGPLFSASQFITDITGPGIAHGAQHRNDEILATRGNKKTEPCSLASVRHSIELLPRRYSVTQFALELIQVVKPTRA